MRRWMVLTIGVILLNGCRDSERSPMEPGQTVLQQAATEDSAPIILRGALPSDGSSSSPSTTSSDTPEFPEQDEPTTDPPPACVSPPEGLLHWWTGDGTGEDFVGSSDAVLLGTAGFDTGHVTSGGGLAFSFDGSDDGMARVEDTPDLNPTGPPGFTVDAWANLRSFESNVGTVLGKGDPFAESYALDHIGTDYRGFARPDSGPAFQIRFPAQLDQWTHLALTWDGDSLRFYVNGAEVGALQAPEVRSTSGAFLGIGSRQETATVDNLEFNGLIDEVEYFGRALGPSEIQAIFNAGTAGKCKVDSLVVQLTPSRPEVRPVLARFFDAVRQSAFDGSVGQERVDTVRLQLQVRLEPFGNLPDSARVLLRSEPVDTSGGHVHDLGQRPAGTFFVGPNPPVSDSTAGARDSVRLLLVALGDTSVVYRTSGLSGIERLRVEVTAFRAGDTLSGVATDSVVIRWRPDLVPHELVAMDRIGLPPDTTYQFSNQDPALSPGQRHGNRNHWIEPGFRDRVLQLFRMYVDSVSDAEEFPIPNPDGTLDTRFVITDVSLAWGGLLDIATTPWRNPHSLHRKGEDMDVRIRTMDPDGRTAFEDFCAKAEIRIRCREEDDPPHWHLRPLRP